MLAGIALAVATGIFVKSGRARHAWVTALPLAWLAIVTTTAALEKIGSADPKIGFLAGAADLAARLAAGTLPPDMAAHAGQLIFNQRLDAVLTLLFLCVLWLVIADMLRIAWRQRRGASVPHGSESPYVCSRLPGTYRA